MSSPMGLSLLLLASLTALLVVAPRLSPPPQAAAAAAAGEEAPPAAGASGAKALASGGGVWGAVLVEEEADDLRLFRRAALEEAGGGAAAAAGEARGPPKVAFLFLTNSDLTFAPLWERFFAGNEARLTVYVHADPSSRLRLPPTPSFRGRFVAAKPTRRADASLIAAARRLLAAALLDDPSNAYFALLSQHCVPLHSFNRLYTTLFPPHPSAAAAPRRLPSYIEAELDHGRVRRAALPERAEARTALDDDGEGEAVRERAGGEHGAVGRERVAREARVREASDHDVVEERVGPPDGREGACGIVHAARRDVGQDEGLGTRPGAGTGASAGGTPTPAALGLGADAGRGLLGGGRGEVLGGAGGGGGGMGCAGGEQEQRGHGCGDAVEGKRDGIFGRERREPTCRGGNEEFTVPACTFSRLHQNHS
nr:unnamed protein product [Digitaria exilis]